MCRGAISCSDITPGRSTETFRSSLLHNGCLYELLNCREKRRGDEGGVG